MEAEKAAWATTVVVASAYDVTCPECGGEFVIPEIPAWDSVRDGNFTICPDCGIEMLIEDWEHAYDG